MLGGYVPVHQSCVQNQTQATLAKAEENELTGNYFTGLIGALLGGVVGAIPNVLAAVFLERIFSLLYALIPIAAYYGYKLLKGKMNKAAFGCTLLSSVLNLFTVQFLIIYISLSRLLGMILSPVASMELFWQLLAGGDLTADLVQSVVFLALGLWFSWGIVTRTTKHEVAGSAMVAATLQPYSAGASSARQVPQTASTSTAGTYRGPELDEK